MKSEQKSKKDNIGTCKEVLYFMDWTKSAFQANVRIINSIYLTPLIEQCTQKKVIENDKIDEISGLSNGSKTIEKSTVMSLAERFREASKKVRSWNENNIQQSDKKKQISLAELAAMHRLQVLIKMSGKMLDIIERITSWTAKNTSIIKKHDKKLKNVLSFTLSMFSVVCSLSEVFQLKSVKIENCKDTYKHHLNLCTKYQQDINVKLSISDPKLYIPPLESRINCFRGSLTLIIENTIFILQTYLCIVKPEQIDIRIGEMSKVLRQLPPRYSDNFHLDLSEETLQMLQEVPQNERSYPLAPLKVDVVERTGNTLESNRI